MVLPKEGDPDSGGLGKEGLDYITSFLSRVLGQGAVVQTDADSVSSAESARSAAARDAEAVEAALASVPEDPELAEVLREEDEVARRLPRSMVKLTEADWQFPMSDVQMGAVIATPGNFSTVSRATYKGRAVCVKEVKVDDEVYAITEITVLRNLQHPGILQLIGATLEHAQGELPSRIVAVTEFMEGGSLSDALRADKSSAKLLPWPHRLSVASQIAHALEFIHAQGVMHRDVKPDNVLLSVPLPHVAKLAPDALRAKLADFGMSRGIYGRAEVQDGRVLAPAHKARHSTRARRQTICGTEAYMAPELLFSAPYTTAVDVFALGGLLAEVATGRECGQRGFLLRDPADGFAMQLAEVEAAAAPGCPVSLVRLAEQCLAYEEADRPQPSAVAEWLDEMIHDAASGKGKKDKALETVTAAGRKQASKLAKQKSERGNGAALTAAALAAGGLPAIENVAPRKAAKDDASCCVVQ